MNEEVKKPSDRLAVTVNNELKEVFMSGGLIRNVVPYYMGMENITEIFSEPQLQNEVIVQCVKPRTMNGTPLKVYTIDDFELSTDESNKLIAWVTEHVLYFFIDSLTTATKLGKRVESQATILAKLMESAIGSQDSTQKKQSVGPSEQSQAN